jgi:hypothetical protein
MQDLVCVWEDRWDEISLYDAPTKELEGLRWCNCTKFIQVMSLLPNITHGLCKQPDSPL